MPSTQSQASAVTLQAFDPTDGTTPVTLPTQDPCCQAPCDPPWITKPACITFTETKTSVLASTEIGDERRRPRLRDRQRDLHAHILSRRQAARRASLHAHAVARRKDDSVPKRSLSPHHYRDGALLGPDHLLSVRLRGPLAADANDSSKLSRCSTARRRAPTRAAAAESTWASSAFGDGGSDTARRASAPRSIVHAGSSSQFGSTVQQASQYTDLQRG